MSIMRKLNTLFRAGARESAERITEANAIRIYRQEIIDAEQLLERRRMALATLIATRKDLEKEIDDARQRVTKREHQIASIAPEQRDDELLLITARDIAATEEHLTAMQQRCVRVRDKINTEELSLRKLLTEIKEHRREVNILASELGRSGSNNPYHCTSTIAGQLQVLRETRTSIGNTISAHDISEESVAEAINRVQGDPVEQQLTARDMNEQSLAINQVLNRLHNIPAPA